MLNEYDYIMFVISLTVLAMPINKCEFVTILRLLSGGEKNFLKF